MRNVGLAGGLLSGLCLAGLIAGADARLVAAAFGGGIVVLGAVRSAEFGVGSIIACVALFQRADLFQVSIPFFGGGLKPTDMLLLATLGGWTARALARATLGDRAQRLPFPATALVVAFVAWAIVCAAVGMSRGAYYKHSLLELRPLLQYALFLPIVSECDVASVRRLVRVVIGAAVVVGVKALVLYARGAGDVASYTGGASRIMSVSFVLLLVAALLGSASYAEGGRRRSWYAAATVLSLLALVVTFQRAAFIGLLAAMVGMIVLVDRAARRRLLVAGLLASAAVTLGAAVLGSGHRPTPNVVTALHRRILSIRDFREDVSAQHRIMEWKAAAGMLRQHPVAGNGLGVPVEFYSPLYDENSNQEGYLSTDIYIHNGYLWLWTKMGLVGLCAFLGLALAAAATAVRGLRHRESRDRSLVVGFSTVMVAFAMVSFFGPMFTEDETAPIAVFVVGSIYILCSGPRGTAPSA
jgi:O-antigen ligase